jgi:hypothetical protein
MLQLTFTKKVAPLVVMICLIVAPLSGLAGELQYPVPCYQGEELAKVQAWEKTWAGKKISSANVDEVKEFVPETLYDLMKNTDRWGESWFEIVPYRQVPVTPGNIKLTKQYYGQSKIGAEGEIVNYTSGVPFPDTTVPVEMAHNFRTRSFGDAYQSEEKGYIVDGRLKYDMSILIRNKMCFFAARTDTPPVPELTPNPKGIWRTFTMEQIDPPEVRDMRILEIHYIDRMKAYDRWMWTPAIRRVRRSSTTERQDPKGGGDNAAYDNLGWDGAIQENTYKYLGTKELLLVRHNDNSKLVHTPGDCITDGTQRERVKAHLIEAVSKDPNFFYQKSVWYLDPESWQMLYSDRYDRRGRLWKVLDQHGMVGTGHNGVQFGHFNGNQMIDVQRIHSTVAQATQEFGVEFERDIFTFKYLQEYGR